jgi:hypothetical protein
VLRAAESRHIIRRVGQMGFCEACNSSLRRCNGSCTSLERPVIELRRPLALVECNLPTRSNARSPPRLANFSCSYYFKISKLFIISLQFFISTQEVNVLYAMLLNMYVFLSFPPTAQRRRTHNIKASDCKLIKNRHVCDSRV